MTLPGLASAADHLLSSAPWATEALRPHAGKRVLFVLSGLEAGVQIRPDGGVTAPSGEDLGPPDATVHVAPLLLARLAAGDTSAWEDLELRGDEAFSAVLRHVLQHLRWDYEEDLSRVTGDIVAHQAGSALRALVRAARDSLRRAGLSAAEYVTEEARLSPPAAEIAAWCEDVRGLSEETARLEERIARLEAARR